MNMKSNKRPGASSLLPSFLAFSFPAVFGVGWGGMGGVRYEMSHSSEQRPETSNSQMNRITLSGPTDGFVVRRRVRRGAGGGGGDSDREEVMQKQEVNDGKSRMRRGLPKPSTYERDDS